MLLKKLSVLLVFTLITSSLLLAEGLYPLTITDSKGRVVTIESEPVKVISVAPNITETLFELGVNDKVIGRSDYCDYPAEAGKVASVGTLFEPNIEKIVELQPDLLIAGTHFQKEIVEKLNSVDITVLIVQEEESIADVYSAIELTGKVINRVNEANTLVKNMKDRIAGITNIINGEKPSVYYVVGFGEYGDYTAGGDTFISEIIETAGGNNIAKDSIGWTYSLEKIIEYNPAIVICSKYYNTPQMLKEAVGYKDLPAILNGSLYPVDNNQIDRPGPRIVDGIEELAKIFYPQLF